MSEKEKENAKENMRMRTGDTGAHRREEPTRRAAPAAARRRGRIPRRRARTRHLKPRDVPQ